MASRKPPESRPQPNLTQAAEKASLVIRGLQARLQQRPLESQETAEDLERQLAQYFSKSTPAASQSSATPMLNDLRSRVVDGVADRILRNWEENSPLEGAVIERLIERLLARFGEPIL